MLSSRLSSLLLSNRPQDHLRVLTILSTVTWLLTALFLYVASFLPLFDTSPHAVIQDGSLSPSWSWATSALRWDAFFFVHIARGGYVYEHDWAFFPGTPWLMRFISKLLFTQSSNEASNWAHLLSSGILAASVCNSAVTLYHLTLHHMKSPSIAYLSALLSLFPSSPVTTRLAGYSEPFFTYLTYKGMLCCARSQWIMATILFTMAGTFRSNGFLLGGFILWGLLLDPILKGTTAISLRRSVYAVMLTLITMTPFVYHQYSAYRVFCSFAAVAPSWCTSVPPSIYTHVQRKYWGVGFMRYWTLQQLPNFLIAAPVILLLFSYSLYHIVLSTIPRVLVLARVQKQQHAHLSPFLVPSLAPHALHALIFTAMLLFASHTQIALRQAASMPCTYWAAAWLVVERPAWGRRWVAWSIVWGAVSIVLWATFLPPA